MGFIYKITNKVNNKVYVGQTNRSLEIRWREHKSRAGCHYTSHLYSAMDKYGIDNFIFEKIEEVAEDYLDDREKFWIEYYDSSNPQKGYNLTIGGQGNRNYKAETIRCLWDEGKSVGEIIVELECNKSTVREALLGHEGYSAHESLSRRKNIRKGVNKFTLKGEFIAHYDSIISAAGGDENIASGIGRCCNGKGKQAYGFQWRFDTEAPPDRLVKSKMGKRKILQLDGDKKVIKTFISAAAAAREVAPDRNVNSASSCIIQVCKGNRQSAYGYGWQYSD